VSRPLRILVADDHPPTRMGVRLALEGHGFTVCAEEASGPAAVQAAVRERPDVCLLDVHMPGGGVEAAAEIVERVPGTTVVMLTVSRNDSDLFDALKAGARGYLLKDLDPARLPEALNAVLVGEVAIPRSLVGLVVEEFRRRSGGGAGLARRNPEDLTSREWEVLDCLREGLSTSQIAKRLFVSDVTVRRHTGTILRKLKVTTREEAVRLAGNRSRNLNAK
jgi:DNA-binding NarL/FixJ family response regulator